MKKNFETQNKANKLSGHMFLSMCTGMIPTSY